MNHIIDSWTFFSNHAHIYFLIALEEEITVREIALKVGITERSVLGILKELEEENYIQRMKVGRNNKYKIVPKKVLKHPLESNVRLQDLVDLIRNAKQSD